MRNYVYKCDVCKKETEQQDMKSLDINSGNINFQGSAFGKTYDICIDCLTKTGFKLNNKENDESKHNTKTLEDKLIEILQDLNVQFYE